MAAPLEPIRPHSAAPAEQKIEPTNNDPTPEERKGDSRFLPVIIVAAIALIVILIASIILVNGKGKKMVPHNQDEHPTSSLVITLPLSS